MGGFMSRLAWGYQTKFTELVILEGRGGGWGGASACRVNCKDYISIRGVWVSI